MKKIMLVPIALSLILILSAITACTTPTVTLPTLSADEQTEADIYAAVVRQVCTSESPSFSKIYLVEATDDSVGDPDISQTEPERLSESVQETITAALDDLSAEFVWVGDFSEVPLNSNSGVRGNGTIITLGNVHFQEDGTVLVSASYYRGNLGAGGQTYIVEQINSTWQVVGNTGTMWIS